MSAVITEIPDTRREVERVIEAARDAVTDEMLGRLAATGAEAMDLVDQVNRSGLAMAIPALAQMVHNGDLERLTQLARVYGSAQDALTDEMVGRLAETLGDSLSLLDRLNRGGSGRLVEMLERLESTGALERIARLLPEVAERLDTVGALLECMEGAAQEGAVRVGATGGLGGLLRLLTNAQTQETVEFLCIFGRRFKARCNRPVSAA
ncbi:MAG: hypothetical protein HYU77_02415 [Betaproteobacteria bacterium]|nr:hypothetical protein [Betaproteobacteria bacterium]